MKKVLVILLYLFNLSFSFAGQEGHGGDIIVSEFMIRANDLKQSIEAIEAEGLPSFSFKDEYNYALEETKVSSEDRVFLGGIEVDAINFPSIDEPRIIIGRERWLDPRLTEVQRKRLVLHEYLSIMGYDDSDYMLSYKLINLINEEDGESALQILTDFYGGIYE